MTRDDDRYARQHHRFVDDHPAVYADPLLYGWHGKLHMEADMAWPVSASVPAGITDDVLAALAAERLVTVRGQRYRMPELDADRGERSAAAKAAADARWDAQRDADASVQTHGADASVQTHGADASGGGMPPDQTRPDQNRPDHLPRGRARGAAGQRAGGAPAAPADTDRTPPARGRAAGALQRLSDLLPPPPGHPKTLDPPAADDGADTPQEGTDR